MKIILRNILIAFLLIAGGTFFILENQIGGLRAFIVSSSSMEPRIGTGSLIVTHYIHPTQLQKEDTITFIAPTKDREFVTHRITSASHKQNLSIFKTKGDNNTSEDTWTLAGGAVVGKVIVTIPYVGFIVSFIKSKIGILLLILLPALYIIVDELFTIANIIKHHKSKRTQENNAITA
jgi:signal peptidase I